MKKGEGRREKEEGRRRKEEGGRKAGARLNTNAAFRYKLPKHSQPSTLSKTPRAREHVNTRTLIFLQSQKHLHPVFSYSIFPGRIFQVLSDHILTG